MIRKSPQASISSGRVSLADTDDTASTKSGNRSSIAFSEAGSTISTIDSDSSSSYTCNYDIIDELSAKEKKAYYVAREIMTSERTFVDILNLLTVDFLNFVRKAERLNGEPIVSETDLEGIVGGLSTLKKLNEGLLKDLEERIANWRENPKLSDIMVKKGPFLKHYSIYIRDFERTIGNLDNCCQKNPLFGAAVREFELSDRCQNLNLKGFMVKPVQRIPQYRLLLEDYAKALGSDCEDHEDTLKAIAIFRGVAEHADEAVRLQVSSDKLMQLQNRLSNATVNIVKNNRQLLKEGELLKVCRKYLQPRFFALMNDSLLCMTYNPAAKDLKLRYELPLAGMRVSLTITEDYKNEFSVISVPRSFNLVAKTEKEREDWMNALNTAIRRNTNIKVRCSSQDQDFQIGKEAPVCIQDTRVTMCQVCSCEFTVTYRRHHCRACGKVVCAKCSASEAPLQYNNYKAARVCDECYRYLLEEFEQKNRRNDSDYTIKTLRSRFKKVIPAVSSRAGNIKRPKPPRLELQANSTICRMSGYLNWKRGKKKSWKRNWFVLMGQVLYVYAASEDPSAIKSIPILGWNVHDEIEQEVIDGVDGKLIFKLVHSSQDPYVFHAETAIFAEKWAIAMKEATVL